MWQYAQTPELMHYGVLGMKWGVRRYQPYPKGKHGKFLGQDRDEDIKIKKGTSAYRVQAHKDLIGEGQTYVSLSKLDHMRYIQASVDGEGGVAVDAMLDQTDNDGRPYSVRLKLSRDVIAPSYSKTMDAFIDAVGQVGVKEVSKTMQRERGKEFVKNFKHLNKDDALDQAYIAFAGTFMRDTKAKEIFFKDLQNQGYNAIIDDWDNKINTQKGYTETPIIIFQKQDSLKKVESVPISKEDSDYFNDMVWQGYSLDKKTQLKWDKWAGDSSYRDNL